MLIPCKFFLQGRCNYSLQFFLRGHCAKGPDCPYLHPNQAADHGLSEQAGLSSSQPSQIAQSKDDVQFEYKFIHGAIVKFENGASIAELTPLARLSAVRLTGLDAQQTIEPVASLVQKLGFDIQENDIQLKTDSTSGQMQVYINSSIPNFAKLFCDEIKNDSTGLTSELTATEIAARPPKWITTRHLNCRKIVISWEHPPRDVHMNFAELFPARRSSDFFKRGIYRILGVKVDASEPVPPQDQEIPKLNYTVILKGVPTYASAEDILKGITIAHERPIDVELINTEPVKSWVFELMLTSHGPLESLTEPKLLGSQYEVTAQFIHERDARKAQAELAEEDQALFPGGTLSIQPRTLVKITTPADIYTAVEGRLDAYRADWQAQGLSFEANTDTVDRSTTVAIEGNATEEIAAASKTLEEIFGGEIIKDGDEPLWTDALESPGITPDALQKLLANDEIVIRRDSKKKQLVYFGPAAAITDVTQQLIEALSQLRFEILLTRGQSAWACRDGLNDLGAKLGYDVVSLDITSNPKRVLILGSKEQYLQAKAFIEHNGVSDTTTEHCAICWSEPEEPMKIECGHVYCLGCFKNLCRYGDTRGNDFKVICEGDKGSCAAQISLRDMQKHLTSAAFENVLETSFASHVQRRPQKFRYCPTPECEYIHGVSTDPNQETCHGCLRVICTSCHQEHGSMSCAQYTDISSGNREAVEELKKQLGIKDCPHCKTPIEKIAGCNHVKCGRCEVHICWVCMKTFPHNDLVYTHMNQEHGGDGLNNEEDDDDDN